MIKPALLLTCVVVTIVGVALLPSHQPSAVKNQVEKPSNALTKPHLIDKNEMSEIEKDWREKQKAYLQQLANKNKPKPAEKPPKDTLTLMLNGKNYKIYGTFVSRDKPFALISDGKKLRQVPKGQEITEGVVLHRIESNKITLAQQGKLIEYKIFERTKHDKK